MLKVAESEGKEGVWTYKLWRNHGWKSPDTARRDLVALENMGFLFLEKQKQTYQLGSGFHVGASKGIPVAPGSAPYVIIPVAFVANTGSYVYQLRPG